MDEGTHTEKEAVLQLMEEIQVEILSRLPVNSLLRFKTVCKSWYSIINSTQFIKKHLNHAHSTHYNQYKDVLGLVIPSWDGSNRCVLYNENSDGIVHAKEFGFPFQLVDVCNYCNGLICFNTAEHGILLWNPSLPMEYKTIPADYDMESPEFWVGMGYDSTTDDYKTMRVPRCNRFSVVELEVFSLKGSSWSKREISKDLTYTIQQKINTCTRDRLHWIGRYFDGRKMRELIVCFDIVEERLDLVNLPGKSTHMFDYKDSLAVIDKTTLWVLVDYNGMKSSWNKIFNFSDKMYSEIMYSEIVDEDDYYFGYCCFTRDGKILIMTRRHKLRIYDPKDGYVRDVVIQGDNNIIREMGALSWFYASPYVASLVSPRGLSNCEN
ncbi:putative F-box protein At3g16210 [Euphorbia lathyris]|uniref:putative F-box protein At3g16210 n=1 Tax=Euphorbia lathyris TaxID=212925 RepID=UPI0033144AA8